MSTDPDAVPDLIAFERIARGAFDALPAAFRQHCADLVIAVAEEAEPEILAEFGIADPYELTGLYEGVALTERSHADPLRVPDTVWLYRRAILAEASQRPDTALADLVSHVLVHEIAHHFGFTDEDIAAIDKWWL